MAGSTTDYTLVPEAGWVQVATSPGFLFIGASIRHKPFYVAMGSSAPSLADTTATATLSWAGLPTDGDTFTLGATTYTFKTNLSTGPTVPNEIKIATTATLQATYVNEAVNGGANIGTHYSTGTVANPQATSTAATTVDTFHAVAGGTAGNAVVFSGTPTNGTLTGSGHLAGGTIGIRGAPAYGHFKVPEALTTNVYVRVSEIAAGEAFNIGVVAD